MGKKNRKREFFKEDSPHGLVKRLMLKKYFQAYVAKTQNEQFTLDTVFIDGFAGEGRYSNEWPCETEKYGSPLIALMVVLDFICKKEQAWGWPASNLDPEDELAELLRAGSRRGEYVDEYARITLIFVESETKRYQRLAVNVELLIIKFLTGHYPTYQYGFSQQEGRKRLNIKTGPFSLNIEIVNTKFAEYRAPMMLQYNSVRSLTFIDPYGFKHTPMAHIKSFVPGAGNEILINLMSSFVNRFVSMCPADVAQLYGIDLKNLEEKDSQAEFVQSVIRFCEPERKHELGNNINICTSNYEAFLKIKTNCKYSLTFEIKDKGNTSFFHMVHITNHIKGIEAMKESMNRCSQREGEMVMSDYDILRKGQKLNLGNMDDPNKVAESIFSKFKGHIRVPIFHVELFVLLETPYLYRKKPLAQFQKMGKISDVVTTDDKCQERKYSFPDKDRVTKESIYWLLSFANEEQISESEVKDEKVIPKKKIYKQTTERIDGHCREMVEDDTNGGLEDIDINKNNVGAVSELIFNEFRGRKRVSIFDVKQHILRETPYLFIKTSLAQLQKLGKITDVVTNEGTCQKRKYTFPDKDQNSKESITWLLSFAGEEQINESVDEVKDEKVIPKEKDKKKTTANATDHSLAKVDVRKGLSIRDQNITNNGAESSPKEKLTKETNAFTREANENKLTGGRNVDKEKEQILATRQPTSLKRFFNAVKVHKTETLAIQHIDGEGKKRKLSSQR